jgi:hypothetical protein
MNGRIVVRLPNGRYFKFYWETHLYTCFEKLIALFIGWWGWTVEGFKYFNGLSLLLRVSNHSSQSTSNSSVSSEVGDEIGNRKSNQGQRTQLKALSKLSYQLLTDTFQKHESVFHNRRAMRSLMLASKRLIEI